VGGARRLGFGEIVENRALGPFVIVAGVRELPQRIRHCAEFEDFRLKLFDMHQRNGPYLRAGPGPIVPQGEQLPDLLDGEAEASGALDKPQ